MNNEQKYKDSEQNISKSNTAMYKTITYHSQVGFIPGMEGCFNIIILIFFLPYQQVKEEKSDTFDTEKALDKSQPIHDRTINNRKRGELPELNKKISTQKPRA